MKEGALRVLGYIGVFLFGCVFVFTYQTPGYVEDIGKDFIKAELEKKTNEKIDSLTVTVGEGALGRLAKKVYQSQQAEIEGIKEQLKRKTYIKLAAVIAKMNDLNCECRKKYAQMIKEGYEFRLTSVAAAQEKIQEFMKMKYMEIVTELQQDIRIFTAVNASVFALLLLISFLKREAVVHLFLPGILLFLATAICSYFYIFEQNWLLTIIYDDYLGFSYLGYVSVVFLFLCDIAVNKARITTEILNGIFKALDSALSVSPC